MSKLNVNLDADVPIEYRDKVQPWLEEVIDWHMAQPRTADLSGCHPQFDKVSFHIGPNRLGRGLRNRVTGVGWATMRLTNYMVLESRPNYTWEFVPDLSVACRVNWAYQVGLKFGCHSWDDPEFEQKEMFDYQMRYLEHLDPDLFSRLSKKIRATEAARRNAERRKKPEPKPKTPTQPRYSPAPSFKPYVNTTTTPQAVPVPELNEFQRKAKAEHQALWDCVMERSQQALCEDYDK